MVDQRVSALNPYQELLNDPDPARSLSAMQIMLESGDAELTRMALEFGLLSPNPAVKRTAFESYLASAPVFSIRFDGTKVKSAHFDNAMKSYWSGNVTPERIGYWRIKVGEYLPEGNCFVNTTDGRGCFVTVNADGIFLTPYHNGQTMSARGVVGDDGAIAGFATIPRVEEPVPFTIRLLD